MTLVQQRAEAFVVCQEAELVTTFIDAFLWFGNEHHVMIVRR